MAYTVIVGTFLLTVQGVIAQETPRTEAPDPKYAWKEAYQHFTRIAEMIDAEKYVEADQQLKACGGALRAPYSDMAKAAREKFRQAFEHQVDEKPPDGQDARLVEDPRLYDPFGKGKYWLVVDFDFRDQNLGGYTAQARMASTLAELQLYKRALARGKQALAAYTKDLRNRSDESGGEDPERLGRELSKWLIYAGVDTPTLQELERLLVGENARAACRSRDRTLRYSFGYLNGYGLEAINELDLQIAAEESSATSKIAQMASQLGLLGDTAGFLAWDVELQSDAEEATKERDVIYLSADRLMIVMNDQAGMDRWFDRFVKAYPRKLELQRSLLENRAWTATECHRYALALAANKALLEMDPSSTKYMLAIGKSLHKLGKYDESIIHFEKVLKQPPGKGGRSDALLPIDPLEDHAAAALALVEVHIALGNAEEAYTYSQLVNDKFPKQFSCLFAHVGSRAAEKLRMARLARLAGKPQEARQLLFELLSHGLLGEEVALELVEDYDRTEGLKKLVTDIDTLAAKDAEAYKKSPEWAIGPVDGYTDAMKLTKELVTIHELQKDRDVDELWKRTLSLDLTTSDHETRKLVWLARHAEKGLISLKSETQNLLRRVLNRPSPREGQAIILLAKLQTPDALTRIRNWVSQFDAKSEDQKNSEEQRSLANAYMQALILIDTPASREFSNRILFAGDDRLATTISEIREIQKAEAQSRAEELDEIDQCESD